MRQEKVARERAGRTTLAPQFTSAAQALFFLLLVVTALSLPILIDRTGFVTRASSYDTMPEQLGAYSYMKKEIFETSDDIDIAFVGSSVLWNAVDTPAVQKELSHALGRDAKVVTLGFNFNGADIPYTILRDLVERRRVRMVIFSVPRLVFTEGPSTTSFRFLRYSENPEVVAGLPLKSQMSLYACTVLRSPQDMLSMIRTTSSEPSRYAGDLGANKELLGMNRDPKSFVRFTPQPRTLTAAELTYSPESRRRFEFTNEELTAHQDHYLRHLVQLLDQHGIPLVILNVPQYSERSNDKVVERFDWSERFGSEIPLIGISPTELFTGLDEKEIELLHCDREHFNKNGNEYFTKTILPALLAVYKDHASKDF